MKSKPPSIEPLNIINNVLGGFIGIAAIFVPLFGITTCTTTTPNTNQTIPSTNTNPKITQQRQLWKTDKIGKS